jgi:carboxynorspermidine decarboxylase
VPKVSKIESILDQIPTPCYVCEEELLEENLKILQSIQEKSGAKILLALKGFAFTALLDKVGKVLHGCSASGLHEAMLACEYVNKEVHTYSPAFKKEEFEKIVKISDHIIFNSFEQWMQFKPMALGKVSCGIRINPEVSAAPTDLYNPCAPFSRLGVTVKNFKPQLLDGIEGLHFHALCEQNVDALRAVLQSFEEKFKNYIPKMKWINFGGGHHITRKDYDIKGLIELIREFRKKYDNIPVYLEPGEAVGWETGALVASVLDIVDNGMKIAILDTSAEAHMPDTLAMPYRAMIRGAANPNEKAYTYRLGGNTCLAGDIMGDYSFDEPLHVGDKIIFEDMIHYTIVKNTTFNGIKLPDLGVLRKNGKFEVVKTFGYEEYRRRN